MLTLSPSRLPARFDILTPMNRAPTLTTQETASDRLNAACYLLLVAVARGEESALSALYDITLSRVFGVALRIVGKSETAEEVVADVFMQVWRNAKDYDAVRARPMTWLLMMTRSRALDHLRRRDEAESHPEPETLTSEAQSGDDDPMNILLAVERNTTLHAALTETSRSVLMRILPGGAMPAHAHDMDEESLVMEGECTLGDIHLKLGDYHLAPRGLSHGSVRSKTGFVVHTRRTPRRIACPRALTSASPSLRLF